MNDQATTQMPRLRTDVTSVVAGVFALSAFTVAVLAGLFGGNEVMVILVRAIMALIVCYPIGLLAGSLLSKVIEDALRDHAQSIPVVNDSTEQSADTVEQGEPVDEEEVIEV